MSILDFVFCLEADMILHLARFINWSLSSRPVHY
jgi:hypothetical protein